jgi:hypothetical protein
MEERGSYGLPGGVLWLCEKAIDIYSPFLLYDLAISCTVSFVRLVTILSCRQITSAAGSLLSLVAARRRKSSRCRSIGSVC